MMDTQKVWGWQIAAYLFLAGVGAGVYLTGFVVSQVVPELTILLRIGILLGAPLVIIGIIFLVIDLGKKTRALLAFSQPGTSWIARGTIIITAFVVLDLIYLGTWIWPFTVIAGAPGLQLTLGIITALFAVLTLIYTGMVLGTAKSIAFWDPWFLPGLFLVSGISTGAMCLTLYLSIYGLSAGQVLQQPLMLLGRYDAFIIIVEALIIAFYLVRMYQRIDARTSARVVTQGNLAPHFWVGVVLAGLVVPFAVEMYLISLLAPATTAMLVLTLAAGIIGLIGGFMLRYLVIAGGASRALNVKGIPVPLPRTSKIADYRQFTL